MNSISNPIIYQEWPPEDLEVLEKCPYCGDAERSLAYPDARDWSFQCAPGAWTYWTCNNCRTLYLDPRPTNDTIGRVYGNYYTHGISKDASNQAVGFAQRLRNECLFHWYGVKQEPRLALHRSIAWLLLPLRPVISVAFPLARLARMQAGSLLDVGCGNGDLIHKAKGMGWEVSGLEIDEKAVEAAMSQGLRVTHGSFEKLESIQQTFDCVVCLHVLEHVHAPLRLIRLLVAATKPGGTIFLALPNERSLLRRLYGKYWRGLEAPRHLCLPSVDALVATLKENGVSDVTVYPSPFHTFAESMRLKHGTSNRLVQIANKLIYISSSILPITRGQDMLELRLTKPDDNSIGR
jgi:SAM-dependent methyltransferase